MAERDLAELEKIARNVSDWRRMSDGMFRVGPLKVGLDGILTWFPGVGDVYGLGASAYLLVQASRAGASTETLVKMGLLLGTDAVVGSIPVAGDLFDVFFRAHARSSRVLLDHIKEQQTTAALPAPKPPPPRRETPYDPPPPPLSPAQPPAPPEHSETDEWEQARRVEELRAQVRQRGGGIVRPRP